MLTKTAAVFFEARFGDEHPELIETNVTSWRRAVAGDLTTAFDFKNPEAWRHVVLPNTDATVVSRLAELVQDATVEARV